MKSSIAIASILLSSQAIAEPFSPSAGTLVVVVPTNEGIVVAADKRTTPGGIYCDGVSKILPASSHSNAAVFVTGLATLRDHSAIKSEDLCKVLVTTPAPIDFGRTTVAFLEKQTSPILDLNGPGLTEAIYADIRPYIEGGQLGPFMGQQRIATIVVVNFERATSTSRIWAFWVQFTGPVGFQLQPLPPTKYGPSDRPEVLPFGENEYLATHVLHGVGRQFLDGSYEAVGAKPSISQVSVSDAYGAATNLIEAATRTADLVRPPSGIGGGIDCVLVGQKTDVLR